MAYGVVPTPRISVQPLAEAEASGQAGFRFSLPDTWHGQSAAFAVEGSVDIQASGIPATDPRKLEPVSEPNGEPEPDRDFGLAHGLSSVTAMVAAASVEDDDLVERPHPRPFAEQLREFKVLGQARNTYIIALTPDGIAVVDQHVAHERVLYERLTVKRFANGVPVQRLVMPVTLDLDRREALLLAEHCESFAAAGWEITPFGGESFLIRSVPAALANKRYERILRDMIEELVSQTVSRRLLVQRDHVTITNACKMAVKAGDPLTIEEMTGLLEQLAETENPYTCPHGRPIVVKIAFSELDKQFKRA
jgi:DNA mismatch repair ATPase MutL